MAAETILDTSGLVSILDPSQAHHAACVQAFKECTGPLASTEAVLTEATHLLGRAKGGREACVDFFLRGGAMLVPMTTATLKRCRRLLERYGDRPMDFADATLVVLAEDLGTRRVLTLDADFEIYRYRGRSRFQVLPNLPRRKRG